MNRNSVWFGLTASAQLVTDTWVTVILTLYLQHYFSQKVEVKKSAIQLLTATALPLLISCSCHNHVILLAATCCSFVLISPIINLSLSLIFIYLLFTKLINAITVSGLLRQTWPAAVAAIKGKTSREHQEKALNLTPPRGHETVKMIIFDIDAAFQICTCNATNLAAMQVAQCMVVFI